jgi:hypothetical protein
VAPWQGSRERWGYFNLSHWIQRELKIDVFEGMKKISSALRRTNGRYGGIFEPQDEEIAR